MGLIDQVRGALQRLRPAEKERTTSDERRTPSRPTAGLARFQADVERGNVVRTCRKMYKADPRAKKMVRTLARDIVSGGFSVDVAGDGATGGAAGEAARALVERLNLTARLDDWLRLTIRDGDSFLELGVDERMEIAEATRKPTLQMHRNSDEADRFSDPARAFWWADAIWMGQRPPRDAVWFAEWQIVHARWDHDENSRYGTPMFAAGTGAWKRVTEGELDVAIRRKTRAGLKFLHVVEGASEPELEAYKEQNKDALDNPFAAVADFFTNRAGAIQAIEGDARLAEIADVQHHIATWMMSGVTPMELLGYGENLNRDVLREKKKEYDETLEQIREWAAAEFIKPLVELQWLLLGIWPAGLEYTITWQPKRTITPADIRDVADAALKLRALGLGDDVIMRLLEQYLPLDALAGATGAPSEEREGTPEVMARSLAALRGVLDGADAR